MLCPFKPIVVTEFVPNPVSSTEVTVATTEFSECIKGKCQAWRYGNYIDKEYCSLCKKG